jgi:t-SNARE complex subunit (syntaxin)
VESASHNTAEAVVQLREASKYQKKSRTKMCVLAVIIAIILGVIVVCIWLGVKYVEIILSLSYHNIIS